MNREYLATLGLVSGGHLLSHLYILAYPPLFPFLIDEFGLNNTQLGLIMSVVALSNFVFQTPAGELVDRVGAKRVFVLGLLLTGSGTALVGVSTSYLALLGFTLLAGIGQAAFHPADYSLLDAVTEGSREGRSFGIHSFAGYAGFAIAPALVGGIGIRFGWQAALFAIGGFGVAYGLIAYVAMPAVHRRKMAEMSTESESSSLRENLSALAKPSILAMFGFFVIITIANKGIQTFTTIFVVADFGLGEVVGNTALTAYFSLAAIGVLIGGVLADRFEPTRVIVTTLAIAAVVTWMTTTGVVVSATILVGLFGAIGVFYGIALPARDRLINSFSTAETTGKSFGFVYTGLPLGGFIGPAMFGGIIDLTGAPSIAFVLVGLFYLGAALIVTAIALASSGWRPTVVGT